MRVSRVYRQEKTGDWHKQILWGRESPEEFGASLYRLAFRCVYREAEEKIFAADGGDWCWTIHHTDFADATGILDWYHSNEHVWTCAKALFSDQAKIKAWAEEALMQMHAERRLRTYEMAPGPGTPLPMQKAQSPLGSHLRCQNQTQVPLPAA